MTDTIITPSAIARDDQSAAGWFVAVIILLAVIFGGIYFIRSGGGATPTNNSGEKGATNINVSLPAAEIPTPKAQGSSEVKGGAGQ